MDDTDAYYTGLILDLWLKGDFLLSELSDSTAGRMIIDTICENIYQ
jgi:hypothetical protein